MTEWYVIDIEAGEIVNCITTDGHRPTLKSFERPETYRLDRNPPLEVLRRYEYWDKRP